ncbi:MAG: biotin/lipoyl-binding protein [Proteobacteria bacterium]|nr:MAG: biotin/lipoyl-binding protein [Pseudomonadota bacterium]
MVLEHGERIETVRLERTASGFSIPGVGELRNTRCPGDGTVQYTYDDQDQVARFSREGDRLWLDAEGFCRLFVDRSQAPAIAADQAASGAVRARSDGKIVRVGAAVGDRVEKGHVLCVLESMKMEFELLAPHAGTVTAVHVTAGQQVQAKRVLCEVTSEEIDPTS